MGLLNCSKWGDGDGDIQGVQLKICVLQVLGE